MASHPAPDLEETATISAPPEEVWRLVGDPRNYARWSPMTTRTFVPGGPVARGSRMFNLNRKGWRVWPTTATVTDFEPGHLIAFRIAENRTTWSYDLEPEGAGTRLVLRRDASRGISSLSRSLTRIALGGDETFTEDLRRGMRATLDAVKAEAEG
jgi:uncharacterized protein YndB with AHSA1/START domain